MARFVARRLVAMIAVLALNVFGDGVRDAFDPRSKLRVER